MTALEKNIPVLHIDRNQLFREGLRRILSDSPFVVQAEAPSLADGLNQVPTVKPMIIIVDTEMHNDLINDLMIKARDNSPEAHVVMLTDTMDLSRLAHALSAGFDGYLLKNMSPDALKQSLRLVMMGETVFPTDLADLLVHNRFVSSGNGGHAGRHGKGLSDRETEILSCLVNGLSNKEIANQLDITEGTVKVHLKGILKKLQLQNRTQAAIWALHNGIIADVSSQIDADESSGALAGLSSRSCVPTG